MNQRSPLPVLFAIGGVLTALLLTTTVLTSGGNEIGNLCKFLMLFVAIVGLAAPRGGIILLIFICAYVDMIKRLMVFSGHVSQLDLYYVLGIPPALLSSIVGSLLISYAIGHRQIEARHWRLFFIAIGLIVLSTGLSFVTGNRSISGLLPIIANGGLYAMLMFLIPVLYPSREDVDLLLKRMFLIFLPVALYGVFQKINGYQDFEIAYLKTGMSIEIKQLEGNDLRPFSTLNSPTALTTISASLAAIAFSCMSVRKAGSGERLLSKWVAAFIILGMLAGVAASTARSGFAVGAIALITWWCFRSQGRTAGFYLSILIGFLCLVIFSKNLIELINPLQTWMISIFGEGEYTDQMIRIGTYTDRLIGYQNLMTNPNMWSWFGYGSNAAGDADLYSHDLLTNSIVKHGLVPVAFVSVVIIVLMVKIHRRLLAVVDSNYRSLSASMMGVMVSLLLVSVLFGNIVAVFPINLILFTCGGILMTLFQLDQAKQTETETETESSAMGQSAAIAALPSATSRPPPSSRVRYPFSRTGRSEVLPVEPRP